MTAIKETGDEFAKLRVRLLALSVGSVVLATSLLFLLILGPFQDGLLPEMDAKVAAVQRALDSELGRALDLGIPIGKLIGVDDFFDDAIKDNPELAYVAITDTAGHVLFRRSAAGANARDLPAELPSPAGGLDAPLRDLGEFRDRWAPLTAGGKTVGAIDVGVPLSFVRNSMLEIALDLGVAVLVSLLATLEILVFLTNRTLAAPIMAIAETVSHGAQGDFTYIADIRAHDELAQLEGTLNGIVLRLHERLNILRARVVALPEGIAAGSARMGAEFAELGRFTFAKGDKPMALRREMLTDIRAPLFLYVLAGELSRSFFPNFVKEVYTAIPGLSPDAVLGLPISAFMFIVAAATPLSGSWADRMGGRKLFLLSLPPTLIGLIGTGLSQNIYQLLGFWSLNAVGYAMATIACQARIAESTSTGNRARGMSLFVTSIMVAAICGTSLGGVMSDRIGFRPTFIFSAVLVVLAGAIVATVFNRHDGKETSRRGASAWTALRVSVGNLRFDALILFGAIPAKIILTGFLYYAVPLYLSSLGYSQSAIGRTMMVYFVIMIFGSSVVARVADGFGLRLPLVAAGGVIAGAGAILLPTLGGIWGVVVAVMLLGIGHSLGTAPLIAMIPEICAREARQVGTTALFGVLRVTERVGSVLGPILAAVLATGFSYAVAARIIGLIVVGGALLLLLSFWLVTRSTTDSSIADEAS